MGAGPLFLFGLAAPAGGKKGNAENMYGTSDIRKGLKILHNGEPYIVVAFQFISLGLIAELMVAGRNPEQAYRVARRV